MLRLLQILVRLEWPLRLLSPVMGRLNPLTAAFRADPYPHYRRLRAEAPVYRHPFFRSWILSRHADVLSVLRDARFSVDRSRAQPPLGVNPFRGLDAEFRGAIARSLLMLDPPDHTRVRNLVGKAFTPRRVEGLRPRIEAVVDELLETRAPRDEMELIRDFAYPLPVIVISELLGVPRDDRERIKAWSDELTGLLDPFSGSQTLESMQRAYLELAAYLRGLFEARRAAPRDDLVSALAAAEAEGDRLSELELLSVCALVLGAGHETTTNLIGNGVLALLRHPGERKRLEEEPELAESAVEELLRFDSPVQMTDRVAAEDLELHGRRVRAGQVVGLLLGSANRDPAAFPEPDRLDLGRPEARRHLAFGQGAHFCLGAALARLEAQVALPRLLRRFPGLRGDPDPPASRWRRSMVLRGLESLPLALD